MFWINDITYDTWKLVPAFTSALQISVITNKDAVEVTIQPPGTVPPDNDAPYPSSPIPKNTPRDFTKTAGHLVYIRAKNGSKARVTGWT